MNSGLGRPDGSRAAREANLRLADQLRSLPVFVSIDIEDGYSDDPDEVATYVVQVDADGVNVEDSSDGRLVEPTRFAAKVAAIKERTPGVFVNARVDTYWLHEQPTVDATIERAAAYVEAGADGVFVPGLSDPDALRTITSSLTAPVNVLAIPGRSLADLADLGVRRVSTGSLPYRAALEAATRTAAAIRDGVAPPPAGTYDDLQARLISYAP